MKTKIQKWGNSLGVRLPKAIADQKGLIEGRDVAVLLKDNQIIIEPTEEVASLHTLLTDITPENTHHETNWSDTQGNEVW